jgi:hypothetical protein
MTDLLTKEQLETLVDDEAHITMAHPCDVGTLSDAAYAARTALHYLSILEMSEKGMRIIDEQRENQQQRAETAEAKLEAIRGICKGSPIYSGGQRTKESLILAIIDKEPCEDCGGSGEYCGECREICKDEPGSCDIAATCPTCKGTGERTRDE